MAKLDRALEWLLFGVAKRASGRGIAAIAIFLYGGLGLALPLVMQWSVLGLVAMNFAATTWAGLVILVWLGVQAEAANRRHLLEWTSDLRRLDSEEFEWLVGEVFRREGWKVDERGRREGPRRQHRPRRQQERRSPNRAVQALAILAGRSRGRARVQRDTYARGFAG